MLKRITLLNFMSHERTVIEPADGLTVLVGPNNCGKSAVVSALRILCNNEPAEYALRHGAKEVAVIVETDDGHVVEWRRKGSAKYLIDGKEFSRLGKGGVPDELHQIVRLPTVDFENKKFDIHFATQKEPLFLLTGSDADRAQFFASSSDAVLLLEMQKRHASNIRDANARKKERENEAKQLNTVLKTLEPIPDLESRLREAEHLHAELQTLDRGVDDLTRAIAQLSRVEHAWRRCEATNQSLAPLSEPPVMAAEEAFAAEIEALLAANRLVDYGRSTTRALANLPAPPKLQDCQQLVELCASLGQSGEMVDRLAAQVAALGRLASPPILADESSLNRWLQQTDLATNNAMACQQRLAALTPLAAPPALVSPNELSSHVESLSDADAKLATCRRSSDVLSRLPVPPALVDATEVRSLADLLLQSEKAANDRGQCVDALAEAVAELAEVEEQVKLFVASDPTCPTCGAALDPQRLIAATRLGKRGVRIHQGHTHE